MTEKRGAKRAVLTPRATKQICDAIADCGTLRLAYTERKLPHDVNTIYRLMRDDEKFAQAVKKARLAGLDTLMSQTIDIAFNTNNDVLQLDDAGKVMINTNAVNRAKLKIDTIFRRAALAKPTEYSDKHWKAEANLIDFPEFAKAKTSKEKLDALCLGVATKRISPETASSLMPLCNFQFQNEEVATIAKEQAEIIKKLGNKND